MQPYLDALIREAEMVRRDSPVPLSTVYFGGGTPSLMTPRQCEGLLAQLTQIFGLQANAEVTLEAHPSTVDAARLSGFRAAGITRLSFGGESLHETELTALGRHHSGARVLDVLLMAREAGFGCVNVDFMYGVPHQTLESWEATLGNVVAARPEHLSLYPLSIEPRTVYARQWRRSLLNLPNDEIVVEMYHLACSALRTAGYEHYEVANWSLPGYRSAHNLAYWQNEQFWALGAGAHGYVKPFRTENVAQTRRYLDLVAAGRRPFLSATLIDTRAEFSESVMLGLRLLCDGLDLREVEARFGIDMRDGFARDLEDLLRAKLVHLNGDVLRLAEAAVPVANEVWQRLVV